MTDKTAAATPNQTNGAIAALILDTSETFQLIPPHSQLRHWSQSGGYQQAWSEGWTMAEDENGRYQLERLDDPSAVEELTYTEPKFASDADALVFVALKAMTGSLYHAEALHSLGARVR